MSYLVALILVVVAILLSVALKKGKIGQKWLETASHIAQIISVVLAIILFLWPTLSNLFPGETESDRIRDVIDTEVQAAVEFDLATLETLYVPDAVVIDRGGTPYDESDDRVLEGWDNIKQYHYVGLEIHINPDTMDLIELEINASGNFAYVTHRGIVRGGKYYPDVTIFKLEKINKQWLITNLEYGNLSQSSESDEYPSGENILPPGSLKQNDKGEE